MSFSLVCCVSDPLLMAFAHARYGYYLYFLFNKKILTKHCNKEKNEIRHIGSTKFVNIGHSSNDVMALDHLDASCEIDPSDWSVDKNTNVRRDI